jgi:mRNA interferase MazF
MLRRGDVVLAAYSGDYGRVRPAVVVQADAVNRVVDSVLITLATTELRGADLLRIGVLPSEANGLREPSQLMVEKTGVIPVEKVKSTIGRLEPDLMEELTRRLALVLGLSDA